MDVQRLTRRLTGMPLFERLGRPIPKAGNPRIHDWGAWVGPEDPSAVAIAIRHQDLHDCLVRPETEEEWRRLLRHVVEHAARLVPYDADEDAWHAPTAAVWLAAWVFTLEEVLLSLEAALPADLVAQISWYAEGHWPCALVPARSGERRDDYVVF